MDASDSSSATGRRSHDSAMLTAASVVQHRPPGRACRCPCTPRTGVPGGYSSTSPVGNAASQPGEPSSVATASRRSSWEPSGGWTGNSSPAATLSSTSRPAAVQKCGHQDVDQAPGHLVQVERRADLPEGVVQQRVPHQGRVHEPLVLGGRHLQHGQGGQARGLPEHGLHAGHRLHPAAFPGADRQHRGGLPAGPDGIQQGGQGRVGRRGGRDQVAEVRPDQWRIQGEDVRGVPVMLDDPSGLIDAQDERPDGDVGQKRCDLPHRTRYRV